MITFVVPIVIGMLVLAGAVPAAAQSKNDLNTSVAASNTNDPAAERNNYTNNAQGEMRMWEQKLNDFNARVETGAPEAQTNASKSLDSAWTAHSDDCDHPFRRIATSCSDRSRPVRRGC